MSLRRRRPHPSVSTIEALSRKEAHVGVVGLGYVGRPLAAALHRYFSVYGYDTDARLIRGLRGDAGAARAPHPNAGRLRGIGDRLTTDLDSSCTEQAVGGNLDDGNRRAPNSRHG